MLLERDRGQHRVAWPLLHPEERPDGSHTFLRVEAAHVGRQRSRVAQRWLGEQKVRDLQAVLLSEADVEDLRVQGVLGDDLCSCLVCRRGRDMEAGDDYLLLARGSGDERPKPLLSAQ